jgi:hypothetical protein
VVGVTLTQHRAPRCTPARCARITVPRRVTVPVNPNSGAAGAEGEAAAGPWVRVLASWARTSSPAWSHRTRAHSSIATHDIESVAMIQTRREPTFARGFAVPPASARVRRSAAFSASRASRSSR